MLRQMQMKKNSRAIARGMVTLGTSMYRISILFFSFESLESISEKRERRKKVKTVKNKLHVK